MIISRVEIMNLQWQKLPVIKEYVIPGYEDVRAGMVKWPMSVIRLQCKDKERLISAADHI